MREVKPGLFRARESDEYPTAERCFILESTRPDEDPTLTIARARVEPGATTALHALDGVDERYLIVRGRGEAQVGDVGGGSEGAGTGGWVEVVPGDVVAIPAGTPQRIRNTGEGDLVFYCICTPPFRPDCYRELE